MPQEQTSYGMDQGLIPYLFGKSAEEVIPSSILALGRGMKSGMDRIYPSLEPLEGGAAPEGSAALGTSSPGPQYEGEGLFSVEPAFVYVPQKGKALGVPSAVEKRREKIIPKGGAGGEKRKGTLDLLDPGPTLADFSPAMTYKSILDLYPASGTVKEAPSSTPLGPGKKGKKGKRSGASRGKKGKISLSQKSYDLREESETPKGKRQAALTAYQRGGK